MIVHLHDNYTDRNLGSIEVTSPEELKTLSSTDWRPIEVNGEMRSFRFHGYRWGRDAGELVGFLYVSERL